MVVKIFYVHCTRDLVLLTFSTDTFFSPFVFTREVLCFRLPIINLIAGEAIHSLSFFFICSQNKEIMSEAATERRKAIAAIYQDGSLSASEKRERIQEMLNSPDSRFVAAAVNPPSSTDSLDLPSPKTIAAARRKAIGDVYQNQSISPTEKQKRIKDLMKAPPDYFASLTSAATNVQQKQSQEVESTPTPPPTARVDMSGEVVNESSTEDSPNVNNEASQNQSLTSESQSEDDLINFDSNSSEDRFEGGQDSFHDESFSRSEGASSMQESSYDDDDGNSSFSSLSNVQEDSVRNNVLLPPPEPSQNQTRTPQLRNMRQDPSPRPDPLPVGDILPPPEGVRNNWNDEDESEESYVGNPLRRKLCGMFWCLVLLSIVGVLVWKFAFDNKDTEPIVIPPSTPTNQPVDQPTFRPVQNPTEPTFEFDPPTEDDCAAIAEGREIPDQDTLWKEEFDIEIDVVFDETPESMDSLMQTLKGRIQEVLLPALAGCPESQQERLLVSQRDILRGTRSLNGSTDPSDVYLTANAKVTFIREMPSTACESSVEPCYKWKVGLDYISKANVSVLTIITIIGRAFQSQQLVTRLDLQQPFKTIDATHIKVRSSSRPPSAKPSIATVRPTVSPQPTLVPTGTPTMSSRPTCESQRVAASYFEGGKMEVEDHDDIDETHEIDCPKKYSLDKDIAIFVSDNLNCEVTCVGTLNATTYGDVCGQTDEITFTLLSEFKEEVTVFFGYLGDTTAEELNCELNTALECVHADIFFEKKKYELGDEILLENDKYNDKDKDKDDETVNNKDLYVFECKYNKYESDLAVLIYDEVTCEIECLGSLSFSKYNKVCTQAEEATFYLDGTYDPHSLMIGYVDEDEMEDAELVCGSQMKLECTHLPMYFRKEEFEEANGSNDQTFTIKCKDSDDFGILVQDSVSCEVQCVGALLYDVSAFCTDGDEVTLSLSGNFQGQTLYFGELDKYAAEDLNCQNLSIPTIPPTAQPSVKPTKQPTAQPTVAPTRKPSSQPSGRPTQSIITSNAVATQAGGTYRWCEVYDYGDDFSQPPPDYECLWCYYGYAWKAIDEITDGNYFSDYYQHHEFFSGSVTSTCTKFGPDHYSPSIAIWQVNLHLIGFVHTVTIYNRSDSNKERLEGCILEILDYNGIVQGTQVLNAAINPQSYVFNADNIVTVRVTQNKPGVPLSLAEVKVEGSFETDVLPLLSTAYLGCFLDNPDPDFADLPDVKGKGGLGYGYTIEGCQTSCFNDGYKYAGVQDGDKCFCGNDYGLYGVRPESECIEGRGAPGRNSVYQVFAFPDQEHEYYMQLQVSTEGPPHSPHYLDAESFTPGEVLTISDQDGTFFRLLHLGGDIYTIESVDNPGLYLGVSSYPVFAGVYEAVFVSDYKPRFRKIEAKMASCNPAAAPAYFSLESVDIPGLYLEEWQERGYFSAYVDDLGLCNPGNKEHFYWASWGPNF